MWYSKENRNNKELTEKFIWIYYYCTHILFNGVYSNQTDGVAIVLPLVPVLANLFMGFHEKWWLTEFSFCQDLFYRRYGDYIFSLIV